jgi:hypothetical protein
MLLTYYIYLCFVLFDFMEDVMHGFQYKVDLQITTLYIA